MSKGNIKGLAHIGIFVKDMEASVDFYKRLGFSLDKRESIHVELAFLSAGTCLIELIEVKDAVRAAGVIDHLAVEVDDIEAAIANAKANGIGIDSSKINSVPILGGVKNVFFEGPDGERLEFFEYA
ncbi:MAG: VOC family protein [Defluviitaleaceae bacterium]|nr:VOC family protein [Defluviitaleaceae bacterium]MCL2836560.1 VOC family protein [Defluviitaleaceae bacterium]